MPRADDFHRDFDWQRKFIPSIKRILANYLITEAPWKEDAQHNTDLMVLEAEVVRVGCRVRSNEYARYHDEFTVRLSRPNGTKTELAKLLSGWGNFFFYGIANADESDFCAWLLGDLNEFRLWHHHYLATHQGKWPGVTKPNRDGSSEFQVYKITDLPSDFVRARVRYQREAA